MEKFYSLITKFLIISLISLVPVFVAGQDANEGESSTKKTRKEKKQDFDPHFYINLNIGASLNHTDLSEHKFAPPSDEWQFGYGGIFGWQFHNIWGVRLQVVNARLEGSKENDKLLKQGSTYDGVRYDAHITDMGLHLTINFSNLISGYKDRTVDVFGVVGVAQSQWKTKSFDMASGTEWRNNGYGNDVPVIGGDKSGSGAGVGNDRTRTFTVPVGLGVMFHVAPKWDITFESQLKVVDSDRLDTWKKGAMPVYRDMYSYTALGVTFKMFYGNPLKKMAKEYENVVFTATPDPLEERGGKVKVHVTGTFPPKYFHDKAAMEFTPVLVYEGGTVPLKTVCFKGQDVAGDGILVPSEGGTITYDDEIEYFDGLYASELEVAPLIFIPKDGLSEEGCNAEYITANYTNIQLDNRKLADGVIATPARLKHSETVLFAFHGYEKVTLIAKGATIYFYVNRHDLNWRVPLNKLDNNKQKLENLANFLRLGYEIKDINFDGWASPEGEETFNEGLSEKRATVTQKYIVNKIKKLVKEKDSKIKVADPENDIAYNINYHGPDWNGFMANVQQSDMDDKNIIQNVINAAGTPAKKEQEIRNMIVIYPELEEKILPSLRRADIGVTCYEPKKPDADILVLSTSNPRALDNKELLYAATLTDDQDRKLQIYKTAINTYPNNYKGYVNAASIEIEKGDLYAAKSHLEKAQSLEPNSGEVFNGLGIVYAMEGDWGKAEENFKKAQQLGENTNYNMAIVMIYKGDYDKAISLFGNTSCDYNVALVQLLNKNYQAAEKNLNCAPKDAQSYYLTAILGSRTDNTSMLYENLTKAVQQDASLKGSAAVDREFIRYFNEPEFQAIVQ